MPAVAPVVAELHRRQTRRFRPARRKNFTLVPLETPERRSKPVAPRIERCEVEKIRIERLVFVAENANAASAAERSNSFVRTLVDVSLLAGGRIFRIGLLVLQQHRIAIAENVADMFRQRDALLLHYWRLRLRGDRIIKNMIGG